VKLLKICGVPDVLFTLIYTNLRVAENKHPVKNIAMTMNTKAKKRLTNNTKTK
jgi:hypothetical protein